MQEFRDVRRHLPGLGFRNRNIWRRKGIKRASESGAIVKRDRKASTSYIQRRLQIGYNRAASLMERMEQEGVVGQPNHSGKREILVGGEDDER